MQDPTSDSQGEQPAEVAEPVAVDQGSPSDLPITGLGLRARARDVLLDAGYRTASGLLMALQLKGDEVLTNLKGFGPKSLADLKARLQEHGYQLPGEAAPAPAVEAATEEQPWPGTVEEEAAPEGPSMGEHLREMFASVGERLGAAFAPVRERIGPKASAYGLYALIAVLVIVALMLPPISLLERVGIAGYTVVNAENPEVEHPDGMTLSVGSESDGRLRVSLDAIPREDFLAPARASSLREAVEALPSHLQVKSPLYTTRVRGKTDEPVMLDIAMPANAEPWETLDLYTWTGDAWEWVGSELHTETPEQEFIRARAIDVPANVVVMQTGPMTRAVSAPVEPGDETSAAAAFLDALNPVGLMLGTDGSILGDQAGLLQPPEGATVAVLPTLRNWSLGQTVARGPLSDVLQNIANSQDNHIANIVLLCTEWGFAGIELDYRGILPEERGAFSDFVRALADALHAEGLQLTVVLEPPAPTDGGWDAGGYDWTAIGAAADAVKVVFPDNPAAYVEGGEAQRLLGWAKAQVSRYKLHMLISSLSVEHAGSETAHISLEEALAPFGESIAAGDVAEIEQNGQVTFDLSGTETIRNVVAHRASGTCQIEYTDSSGEGRTVWLGTAAGLAAKLDWAQRYNLAGVAISGMLTPGNAPGTLDVVSVYRAGSAPATAPDVDVAWMVTSAAALIDQQTSPLTSTGYTWTAMVATGTYTVSASIAGLDRGSVSIRVGMATPEQPTTTETPLSAGETACLKASFVQDVTIPDNTQMSKGEAFVKTWRLKNSGTCDWPQSTVLVKVQSGLGGAESVAVGSVAVGETVDISVDLATPDSDGSFSGKYALKVDDVEIPGGDVYALVKVGEGGAVAAVTTVSGGFELGGHIRNEGYPYADKMHYAGMNWAKVQVRYPGNAGGTINAAHAKGFKIQVSALGPANMVTQSGFEQTVANWVAEMAAAGADAIEVWNEPNIDREWQSGRIDPAAYTRLLCAAYQAIKAANPNTLVISAAPSPTGYYGGACTPTGCDDGPWMAGMRDAGAAQCMDYLGAHHNQGATSPSARSNHPHNPSSTHTSYFFLPQTEMYYNTFGGTRQIFYTEMGYVTPEGTCACGLPENFAWGNGTSLAEHAAWLGEAVQLSINTGMVRCVIVWNVDYARNDCCECNPGQRDCDPQASYAIIRPGGGCPACDTLHNILGTR